jgi:sugar/nucleoside kinase (ribokinase family)
MTRFDVTLVGEANIDLVLYGLPQTLPTERELLATDMALLLGGSPAITAHNLAALGSSVGFITSVADDVFATACIRDLESAGVDLSRTVRAKAGVGTGITVLLQHEHARRTLTYPGTVTGLRFEDLDLRYLQSARHFHLSSYFLQKHLRDDVPRLFATLKRAGLTISLDTNDDPSGLWSNSLGDALQYVDVLMPNEREACYLSGEPDLDSAIRRLAESVPLVVVKRGSDGALACKGHERFTSRAVSVATVDAVGAGDSFNAGFLHGYVRGWPIERCLRFGNLAGALSTTALGGTGAFRDPQCVEAFLAIHTDKFSTAL